MKNRLALIVIISLFSSCLLASMLPSFFNIYEKKLSVEDQAKFNDAYEIEAESDPPLLQESKIIVEIEKLNWFSVVNKIFEKFSNARVVDVETKQEYQVMRVGGYNHADVETLTATDTAVFKSLYNGTWSWTRRPVWVEIDGIWIAGSINGMPHSYQYIEDNNEDGHTCIHFYMSRTHGTDNLDPAHQNAVETAMQKSDELNAYLNS